MGEPNISINVKLFTAITFNNQNIYQKIKQILEQKFGNIDLQSEIYDFNFTDYYMAEMGKNLKKQFLSFKKLIQPEKLVNIKLWTNDIEKQFSINENRQVNIDPGYLTNANIILATTKNYNHRIYLGKGIYGDVHLRYKNKQFQPNEWTYPDYRQTGTIEFFLKVRKLYRESLKKFNR